ncbi:hypothetical protein [Acinetobacter sp. YH01009]|uniref:hypothetical protein n=1 Tax=Acinetobacter TaxID=469 RepID=UPI0015D3DF1A|nr:hypothetical protein [Acinetobacter sp. YH01009]
MRNKDLDPKIGLPLKVITARLEHVKMNLPGLMKRVESYAIERQKSDDLHECLISGDEWTYAALDCKDPIWRKRLKRTTNIMGIQSESTEIPLSFINQLPCNIGEIITLGSWSLTKNIYRFEDQVIQMLVKTKYNRSLPGFLLNLPDIAIYIQTDNADLHINDEQVVGVIFAKNTLHDKQVLFTTVYTDSGLGKTIAMNFPDEDDFESTVEDCMTDFIDTFFDEKRPDDVEVATYTELQKKLINLILWFSQKEPDFRPLSNENSTYKPKLELVKRELRLFEASKYKPTLVGIETNKKIQETLKAREDDIKSGKYVGTKIPHPRKPHWNFYWLGKRGTREKWVNHWIPFKIVGGVPKEKSV